MNFRRSVLGEIAIRSGVSFAGVDVSSLLRRLILFDDVVIKSFRLREIPTLVRAFGKTGLADLLKSGTLKLACEFTVLAGDFSRGGIRSNPLEHFSFGIVDIADREGILKSELRASQGVPGLNNRERSALEELVWSALVRPHGTYGKDLLAQVEADLRANTPALKAALVEQLRQQTYAPAATTQVTIAVVEPSARVFKINNNLTGALGFSPEKAHGLLQSAVFAVANLNHRLGEMEAYSAITGFSESEAPLLFGKLAGILEPLNPAVSEEQFKRVVQIAGLPDLNGTVRIDVDALLKIRDSAECREFREWLTTLPDVSDAEIKHMVAGLRAKLTTIFSGTVGRAVRFAATTGVGLVPGAGLVLGPVASAIDSFLIDRVLPRSGIVAFLAVKYPSLFVSS